MFKTESLIAFEKVAKYQSFTKAANDLQQTPMAVSKQVSSLESKLKQPLFERTTRKVNLTEFGHQFLERTTAILNQHSLLEEWLESKGEQIQGTLKILTQSIETYQVSVYPWLSDFCSKYPGLELELGIDENVIDINASHHDIYWGIGAYLGQSSSGLKSRLLWRCPYGIYASPGYLKKYGEPKSLKALRHHQIIGYLHNQPSNLLVINKKIRKTSPHPDYLALDCKIKAVSGLIELAADGLGLVNLASDNHQVIDMVKRKKLQPVLQKYWWQHAEVYLYYHQVKYQQPKVRAFIDYFLSKRAEWHESNSR